VAERKLGQRQATNDASQSPSIKEVVVDDTPASKSIDIGTSKGKANDNKKVFVGDRPASIDIGTSKGKA
jgi:hypothetical protein